MESSICLYWSARKLYPEAKLVFLVNDLSKIEPIHGELFEKLGVSVKEIPAEFVPGKKIRFKGAFFKFDAINYIAMYGTEYNFLLDNDVIFNIRDETLDFFIINNSSLAYAISQPGEYYRSKVYLYRQFKKICNDNIHINCEWIGGEFIAGGKYFFKEIFGVIKKNINKYWHIYKEIPHIGNEVLLSLAVNIIASRNSRGVVFNSHVIYRYWSRGTFKAQIPYRLLKNVPIIHLPDQKRFGFKKLAKIIRRKPEITINQKKIAKILGFYFFSYQALYRNPIAMLRRRLFVR